MSYVQIRSGGNALNRGRTIDTAGQSRGYPSYPALWSTSKNSVLSILYQDGSGIYLTNEKKFRLAVIGGSMWFSADLLLPTHIPDNIYVITWASEWANQTNTNIDYSGLVTQAIDYREALSVVVGANVPISFYRNIPDNQDRSVPWEDTGAWIAGVNSTGGYDGAWIAYSWWPPSALKFASFYLRQRNGFWSLNPSKTGWANFNESAPYDANGALYVGEWEAYGGLRWKYTNRENNIQLMDIKHVRGDIYQLESPDGKRLNQAGHWFQLFPLISIYNGVEFFNGNDNGTFDIEIVAVSDTSIGFIVTDELVYRLGPWIGTQTSQGTAFGQFTPTNVIANMPKGGNQCSVNTWDGVQLDCYQQPVPYNFTLGSNECTTTDSFNNDTHCQEWGKLNKGEQLEQRLRSLCAGSDYQQGSVCNCFLNDNVYYNRIASELGTTAARSIQATNTLQCQSGLCTQDGSLSAQLYFYGGKRCDVCLQIFELNLNAQQINANINSIQNCTAVDSTYRWEDLLVRLDQLGAYREGTGGTYRDVVISRDEQTVYLNPTTTKGKYALQQLPFLQYVPTKDQYGRIIISRSLWGSSVSSYSRDIVLFLLYIRAPPQ